MIIVDKKKRKLGDTAYRESDGNFFTLSNYTLSYSGAVQQTEIIEGVFGIDKRTVFQALLSAKIIFAENMVPGDEANIYIGIYESGNDLGVEGDMAGIGLGTTIMNSSLVNPFTANRVFDLYPLTYDLRIISTMISQSVTPTDWAMQEIRLSLFTIN